jgi:hypothetical protein
MRRYIVVVVCALGLFLGAKTSLATSYVVGTCRPSLPSFNTISEAVAAVPSGATVMVCPGSYYEQVTINTSLTLEGVSSGDSDRPIIFPPSTGLVVNTSGVLVGQSLSIAAQILVTTGPVNISNLTVDGTGNDVPTPDFFVGVFYGAGAFGTVDQVTARNEVNEANGAGLWAENDTSSPTSVTFENCSVYNADNLGIAAISNATPSALTATVKGNSVSDVLNGIAVIGATGSVSDNLVTDIVSFSNGESSEEGVGGIVAVSNGAAPAPITDNTVADSVSLGIVGLLNATDVVIKSNTVATAADGGIALVPTSSGPTGATIQSNKIVASPVGIEFSCSTATASGNTISNVSTGLNDVPLDFNPGSNIYTNVDSIENQMTCTSASEAAMSALPAATRAVAAAVKALRGVKLQFPLVLKRTSSTSEPLRP